MTFMQFQPIREEPKEQPAALPKAAAKGKAVTTTKRPSKSDPSPASRATQNLLVHIPGEASGFYLLGIETLGRPDGAPPAMSAVVVGVLALALLLVVRWLAGASIAVVATSIGAFLLWMAVFDNGFLTLTGFGIANPLGVVVALFYSTLITVLGSAGKLK